MKKRSRFVGLSSAAVAAAAAAAILGTTHSSITRADTLTWDANGSTDPLGADGSGTWDTSTPNWVSGGTTNVNWTNGSSALFGNTMTSAAPNPAANDVDLAAPIVAQDITLATGSDGSIYNISDFGGGSLTLNGNVTKQTGGGALTMLLANGLALGTGDHTFTLQDTPGDAAELTISAAISGSGNVVLDNGANASGYPSWGTLVFNTGNSYAGNTTVNDGRLVVTTAGALGSGAITIGSIGTLSVGGAGTSTSGVSISQPITIKRSVYSGGDFGNYPAALITANGSGTSTISGSLVIDSTEGRIQANTSTLVISTSVTQGPDVTAGTSTLTLDGDFAGFITLAADNTAFGAAGNTIAIIGGVEVNASSEANLGGATSNLNLASGFIHPTGALATSPFMTNFGTHVLAGGTVGTGLDLDSGVTFTVNGLSGAGVGQRGLGTLNFQGTNTFTGTPFYDGGLDPSNLVNGRGGTINFQAGSTTSQHGLRIRSATVNIAGTLNVGSSFTSIGVDSTGTGGQPDLATVNINNGGSLIEGTGDDFNISDNANTQGTINLHAGGVLTTGGITWLGKSNGAVGTINQDGGTLTINRGGNFGFVIADGRGATTPTGHYNLSGGTFTSAGEVYVGEGGSNAVGGNRAHGTWTQTGGTANVNNWFVVGRESAAGSVDISGGTLNHNGGNMSLGDSNAGGETNTITVHGTAVINDIAGEFWVGNSVGDITNMTVSDTASITVNNWLPVGRGGAQGTLDLSGSSIVTKAGPNNAYVGESTNAVTSTMTVRQNAVFNETSGEFWVGQGGGVGVLNIQDAGSFTVNSWFAIGRNGGTGTVNLSGGTITQVNNFFDIGAGGTGTVNVTGGTINALKSYIGETGSGTATLNMNGGTANLGPTIFANAGSVTGLINLNAGTVSGTQFTAQNGGGTGTGTFFFNGGTLLASADNTNFIGLKVTSLVSTGGAKINTNAHAITVNSVLKHDPALSGADGGLAVSGTGTLILTGAETYSGNTTISAGTLTLNSGASLASTNYTAASTATFNINGSIPTTSNVTAAGGAVNFAGAPTTAAASRTINSLTVTAGGTATITTSGASFTPMTLNVSTPLSVTGTGKIDLKNNVLIAPGTPSTALALITAVPSQLVTSITTPALAVGYGNAGGGNFEARATLLGDSDLDGRVNVADLANLAGNFGATAGVFWLGGDFDYNGNVNVADLADLAGNFGNQLNASGVAEGGGGGSAAPAALSAGGVSGAAVPEPTALGLLVSSALATGMVGGRRRHRRRHHGRRSQ
jgi:autotransporter-associated beta strand protein